MPLAAQVIPPHRSEVPPRETVVYVRPWGDNDLDGLTAGTGPGDPGTALSEVGGLEEADLRMVNSLHGERWVFDVTGCNITIPRNWALKSPVSGDGDDLVIPVSPDHPSYIRRASLTIRAEPATVLTLNAGTTSTLAEPTHDMLVVTDTSQAFAVNEHAGRFVSGSGFFEWGAVQENDATSLVVSCAGALTGPVEIWEPSATLTIGNPADFFGNPGFRLMALCDVTLVGLRLRAPGTFSSAISVRAPGGGVQLWLCDVEGMQFDGGRDATIEACHFSGKVFAQSDQAIDMKRSVVAGVTIASQGIGGSGNQFLLNNRIVGCTPWPVFGNPDLLGGFQIEGCAFEDSVGAAVQYTGGNRGSIRNSSIDDTVVSAGRSGHAVEAAGPGRVEVRAVTGMGSAGHGISARDGAHVKVDAPSTVTGAGGDLEVGSIGTRTYAQLDAQGGNLADATAPSAELARVHR